MVEQEILLQRFKEHRGNKLKFQGLDTSAPLNSLANPLNKNTQMEITLVIGVVENEQNIETQFETYWAVSVIGALRGGRDFFITGDSTDLFDNNYGKHGPTLSFPTRRGARNLGECTGSTQGCSSREFIGI